MSDINEPKLHDFLAASLIPTNEQRIVAALEQIVVLLTPKATPAEPPKATPTLGRRK